MADLKHIFGQDLQLSAVGGLLAVSGSDQGREKVIRRLLTNPGDHLADLTYGAGLAAMIGQPARDERIKARVLRQMRLEAFVDQRQTPAVAVQTNPANGTTNLDIQYIDAVTGQTSLLSNLALGGRE